MRLLHLISRFRMNKAQEWVDRLDAALPQTQCTRCGYPDCRSYAQAIADGVAPINQCPPGGAEGIQRLAALTGQAMQALNPAHGQEGPRLMMWIDENWCIGCTLCIKACPVDAIVGVNKHMHTILEPLCTGCELCLPACPVDCIHTEPTHTTTGWAAWSPAQADAARQRHIFRRQRLARQQDEHAVKRYAKAAEKLSDLAHHSQHTDPAVLNKKRAMLDMILAKAKTRIQVSPQSQ